MRPRDLSQHPWGRGWASPQPPVLERWPQLRASWEGAAGGTWALVGPGHTPLPSPGALGPLPAQGSAFPSFLSHCQGRFVTHPHPQRPVLNPTGSRGICQQQLPPEPAPQDYGPQGGGTGPACSPQLQEPWVPAGVTIWAHSVPPPPGPMLKAGGVPLLAHPWGRGAPCVQAACPSPWAALTAACPLPALQARGATHL